MAGHVATGSRRRRARLWPEAVLELSIVLYCLEIPSAAAPDPLAIVYDVRHADLIISATAPLEALGFEVFALGDVNGDGDDDLAFFGGRTPQLHAFILYGRSDIPKDLNLDDWASWGTLLESDDPEVWPVPSPLGDVNGDGLDDLAFRKSRARSLPVFTGISLTDPAAITVFYGRGDMPSAVDVDALFQDPSGLLIHPRDSERASRFGTAPVGADINGDGFSDVILSTPGARVPGTFQSGLVYVLFGGPGLPATVSVADIGSGIPGSAFFLSSRADLPETSPSRLGSGMASIGDVDRDGFDDILLSAPGWEIDELEAHWDAGAVALVHGARSWAPLVDLDEPAIARTLFVSEFGGDLWHNSLGGSYVGSAGDLNLDGQPDLLLSTSSSQYKRFEVAPHGFVVASIPPTAPVEVNVRAPSVFCAVSPSRLGPALTQAIAVPDFDGDRAPDLAAAVPTHFATRTGFGGLGMAYLLLGHPGLSGELSLSESPPHSIQFPAWEHLSYLGTAIASCDINGDGFSDLAIGAPGQTFDPSAPTIGRVYLILGGADVREPLQLSHFIPRSSPPAGGRLIALHGQGFTSHTRVFFGDAEAFDRRVIDSRFMEVEAPPSPAPGFVQIRVANASADLRFDLLFEYRAETLPASIRVSEIARHLISIPMSSMGLPLGFSTFSRWISRAGDVTGDGIDDLTFCTNASLSRDNFERLYLLRGDARLPPTVRQEDLPNYGTAFFLPEKRTGLWDAVGAGDVNGDGFADIAVASRRPQDVFVILGGTFADGELDIYDLHARGGVRIITGLEVGWLTRLGDVNGDGFADIALLEYNGATSGGPLGTISLYLGGSQLPSSVSFLELPMIASRVPDGGYYSYMAGPWEIGDVDGDGLDDIGVASYLYWDDTESEGNQCFYDVYVLFGRPHFQHRSSIEDEVAAGMAVRIAHCDSLLQGRSIEWYVSAMRPAGDMDHDGIRDMLLAVRHTTAALPAPGEGAYLLHGAPRSRFPHDRRLAEPEDFDGAALWDLSYNNNEEGLFGIDGGRDFSGDGSPDFLMQESKYKNKGPARLFMVSYPDPDDKVSHLLSEIPEGKLPGVALEDDAIFSVTWPNGAVFAGDLNHDGFEDIATSCSEGVYIWLNPNGEPVDRGPEFVRGDSNQDGTRDIGDAILALSYLFVPGEPAPPCVDALDLNDDGALDLGDPVHLLNWLFASGAAPSAPSQACGPDPTDDSLTCLESVCP
ncbi:MAG: FG-GAP repeat protein [Planctomycetes bacterium]|nr:FG-GAP repeat protein [Planctomycetota bacterium]